MFVWRHPSYLPASLLLVAALCVQPAPVRADEPTDIGEPVVREELDVPSESQEEYVEEAEEEEEDVDTITVTANRREESLQSAAVSVTALKGNFIEEVGLTQFTEIQKYTPNLQIIPQSDSRSTSIRIRGIGSVGNNAGIDPSVGVFIDGVYQGRAGMSVADLIDVESVEVLRGPQGTLYGKNTAAGAITVRTRRPSFDPEGMAELVVGNYGLVEGRGMANFPIIEDVLATRLTGYATRRDGYEVTEAPGVEGTEVNASKKWGVRSSTLWDVTDTFSLYFMGDYSRVAENGTAADILEYGDDPYFLDSAQTLADNWVPQVNLPTPVSGDRIVDVDFIPRNFVAVGGASLEATLDMWDHEFTLLTSYRNYTSDSTFDGDFSRLNAILSDTDVFLNQVSTELRVVSPPMEYFDYVAGFYFFWSQMQTDDKLGFTADYLVYSSLPGGDGTQAQFNIGDNLHTTTSVAGYADTNIHISELWGDTPDITITGGVRVGWEEKAHEASQISQGPLGNLPTPVSGPDFFTDDSEDDTYVTGRAILKWQATPDIMTYASFATGYKSGGYNQLRPAAGGAVEPVLWFEPENSMSYEIGLRSTWLSRMITFNMTGFYTDYDDFQAQVFNGLGINVLNAGSFITYGFEAELTMVPIPEWITVLGVGYTITEYRDFPNGPCIGEDFREWFTTGQTPPGSNCRSGSALTEGGGTQDMKGKPLDQTPKLNLTLFTTYEDAMPTVDVWKLGAVESNWFVSMDYNYQSSRYLNAALDPKLKSDPINLLGFRAGLRSPTGAWEATLWVRNVTDTDFTVIGFDVPTMGGLATILGPPRTFGATMRVRF